MQLHIGVDIHPGSPNDFKFGKMSSSIESDRGSIVNALGAFERHDELVSLIQSYAGESTT